MSFTEITEIKNSQNNKFISTCFNFLKFINVKILTVIKNLYVKIQAHYEQRSRNKLEFDSETICQFLKVSVDWKELFMP